MTTKGNYYISKNDIFGRYMVAGKLIKTGELILSEKPTLVGPPVDGKAICFNCCRHVANIEYVFCSNCKAAILCSPRCVGMFHSEKECAALKDAKIEGNVLAENSQLIHPLRCLLFQKYKSKVWNTMMELESHLERRRNTPVWRRHMITVERVLRENNFISEADLKEELVQKVCGILDVNSFEVRPPQSHTGMIINPENQCLRGLYLKAALMAHDCVGNTHLSIDDDFVLTIRASVDIIENSPILFNYSNVLQGNIDRGQHLREGKYFECTCDRCRDPTELGSELSSLKCHLCRKGLIRPKIVTSDWECSGCKKTFKNYLIQSAIEEGRRRIEEVGPSVTAMENLLSRLLQTFHPNHFLILELQQNLMGLYLRSPPNKSNLLRRISLCRGLLDVFCNVELGLSRLKAITLYELHSATADLAHKQHREKEINEEELVGQLLLAETTLKEAIKHLLYEPTKSPEGRLAQTALSELKMLRLSINNIQKDLLNAKVDSKDSRKVLKKGDNDIKAKQTPSTAKEGNTIKNIKNADSKTSKKRNRRKKQ